MRLPSVIALKEYIPAARKPAFTRFNVFLRDRFECQYCGEGRPTQDLTFDHVVPRSRGGRTTWNKFSLAGNIVCGRGQRLCANIRTVLWFWCIVKNSRPGRGGACG